MNGWILIRVIFNLLVFGCCWFDYQEINGLKETLIKKTMDIYGLERRIEGLETKIGDLQNSNNELRADLIEHDARIREFEGDSYEE